MDLGNTIQTMTAPPAPQHQGGRWSREKRVRWGAEDKDTPPRLVLSLLGWTVSGAERLLVGKGQCVPSRAPPSPASALGFIKIALDWGLGHHGGRGLRGLWSMLVAFA